jgi:outer membrane protein
MRSSQLKLVALTLSLVMVFPFVSLAADKAKTSDSLKIGVLDVKRAIESTKDGKNIEKQLKKELDKRQKQLNKLSGDIKKMGEDLQKKSAVLSDEARTKKQQEIQGEMVKYQKLVQESNVEMRKKEEKLIGPILKKMETIVDKLAKKEGFTMIFQKSESGPNAVIWAKKEIDITDKVIKAYGK